MYVASGQFIAEIGCFVPLQAHRDSNAARGMMTRCDLAARSIWKSHQSGVKKILRRGRFRVVRVDCEPHAADIRTQIKSFISYGCWEWTQRGGRWITVESGADDTMKGSDRSRRDSEDESLRHGRMSAGNPDEARKAKLGLAIRAAVKSRMLNSCFLMGAVVPRRTLTCANRVRGPSGTMHVDCTPSYPCLSVLKLKRIGPSSAHVSIPFFVRCASLCRRDGCVHLALSTGKGVSHAPRSAVALWSDPRGQNTNVRGLDIALNVWICPASRHYDLENGLHRTKPDAWLDD